MILTVEGRSMGWADDTEDRWLLLLPTNAKWDEHLPYSVGARPDLSGCFWLSITHPNVPKVLMGTELNYWRCLAANAQKIYFRNRSGPPPGAYDNPIKHNWPDEDYWYEHWKVGGLYGKQWYGEKNPMELRKNTQGMPLGATPTTFGFDQWTKVVGVKHDPKGDLKRTLEFFRQKPTDPHEGMAFEHHQWVPDDWSWDPFLEKFVTQGESTTTDPKISKSAGIL